MDYKNTINLPKTSFPMKASLPQKEPEMLKQWEEKGIYKEITVSRKDSDKFILHDGPPYANGHIHIGTALNKILKDFIVKSKTMSGFSTVYIPGWDCHGLPIELNVEKKLGKEKNRLSKTEIRTNCRKYAENFVNIQRQEFKRLGVFGDWDNPYLTMSNGYSASIVREFAKFAESGIVYKQKKPIQWCASCNTALAEAEVEYHDHTSPSVYVKFPLISDIGSKYPALQGQNVSVLIWTTTPWTIPANLAICLGPDFVYTAVKIKNEVIILAEELLQQTMLNCDIAGFEILDRVSAHELEGMKCLHPLYDRESLIILGDHVTLEAGTGCVHTAPGHGHDDYVIGSKYRLDVYAPVDDKGRFTEEVGDFKGEYVFDANRAISNALLEKGALLKEMQITHSYPHCWRCKKPVIFRATEQWFISMEKCGLREKALDCISKTQWIPPWGIDRITGMVQNRPDWCISRQRSWGVPIIAFYCKDCGKILLEASVINHVADLFEKHGSDIWFSMDEKSLLPENTKCVSCSSENFQKETDILDVWFDSGSSHAAVLEKHSQLQSPCDMYLEGSDQHRGWFQSSLLISVGTRGRAPYKSVLTHGFVVDGKGEKMAKSKGNVVSPDEVIKIYGAEILRLWVCSENYQEDMRISQDILKRLSEAYRKIRNTCRFMLGNLSDFNPDTEMVEYSKLPEIDRWALMRMNELVKKVKDAYLRYEFHTIYHSVLNFCINDMSSVYLDILKDRLYCQAPGSVLRKASQSVIYKITDSLIRLLAPVLSFTAEEVWQSISDNHESSIHLLYFPEYEHDYSDSELSKKWKILLAVRSRVLKEIESARERKELGNSLEASVNLACTEPLYVFLNGYEKDLPDIFIVSEVCLNRKPLEEKKTLEEFVEDCGITIKKAEGEKCPRCWVYFTPETQGQKTCKKCREALNEINKNQP